MLRTNTEIDVIQQYHITPVSIKSPIDNNIFLNYYNENQYRVTHKNTGPKTITLFRETPLILKDLIKYLKSIFGDFYVTSTQIFDVTMPHIIHNDDELDHIPFLAFCLPLRIFGTSDDIKLVTFDQYYYHGGAKFFNGDNTEREVFFNKTVTTYDDVSFLSYVGINDKFKQDYLSHLKDDWLHGLSINTVLDWKIGDVLCFNCNQLHCSSDFVAKGVTSKQALSIFTAKEK